MLKVLLRQCVTVCVRGGCVFVISSMCPYVTYKYMVKEGIRRRKNRDSSRS